MKKLKYFIIVVLIIIIVTLLYFYVFKSNLHSDNFSNVDSTNSLATNTNTNTNTNSNYHSDSNSINTQVINTTNDIEESKVDDYFILYNGYEIELKPGVQYLSDMEVNKTNNDKYNITYYNYQNGKYVGETKGNFGEETYEGVSVVTNVSKIAISKKYNTIPRVYTKINKLPEQLSDMTDYTSLDINAIDLDNDGKEEYVISGIVNYSSNQIEDDKPQASSYIMLFDNNYKKIADLVILEKGFWANIKEESTKVFLTLDDVDYIDIDNDGIMEILINVPTYEGTRLSIIKYHQNKIEGETNLQASVTP